MSIPSLGTILNQVFSFHFIADNIHKKYKEQILNVGIFVRESASCTYIVNLSYCTKYQTIRSNMDQPSYKVPVRILLS